MTAAEFMTDCKPYRANVGIALFNASGQVLIGRRFRDDGPEIIFPGLEWQMPQGGIDADEDPRQAALRELYEETNVTSVEYLAEAPEWYAYDLPDDVSQRAWRGRYRGQKQKWYALRFTGADSEINILTPGDGHEPEFIDWRWVRSSELPDLVVPFKRQTYERVVQEFGKFGV